MTKSILSALSSMRSLAGFSLLLDILLLACILSAAACSSATTSAKLHDPSKVSLEFRRLGQSSLRPIHQGSGDMTMGLSGLGVEQSGTLRKENGAILLECARCTDGSLRLLSENGATAPADISVREVIELRKRNQRKMKLGYEYDVSQGESLFPELETSWSNVEYYDQTNEPVRWLGWALVPGGFLTLAGTAVMIFADVGSGLAMLLPGVALDAFGVIQLVKSPTTDRFGPDGRLRPPPPVTKKEREAEALDREPEAEPEPDDDLDEEPAPVEEVEKREEEPAPVEEVEKREEEPAPVEEVEKREEEPAPVEEVEKKEKKTKKGKKDEGFDDFLL